jgi:hypothetical protein
MSGRYPDSNWGDPNSTDKRSTSGYAFELAGGMLSRASREQRTTATSIRRRSCKVFGYIVWQALGLYIIPRYQCLIKALLFHSSFFSLLRVFWLLS